MAAKTLFDASMSYSEHEVLLYNARQRPELWRLLLGLALIAVVVIGLNQALLALLLAAFGNERGWALFADIETAKTPSTALVFLMLTGILGVGSYVTVRRLHQRSLRSLTGPLARAWAQFARVAAALIVLYGVIGILPPYGRYDGVTQGLSTGTWLLILPLSVFALLVQTASEEMVFRGYIQQQLAVRFSHPLVWLLIPSALFAAGHYSPGLYGGNALMVVLWAFVFGLAAADLTARFGTLGPAIGMHWANNFWAILFLAPQGSLSGLALYHLPFDFADETAIAMLLPVEFAMIGLSWLTARIALRH